MGAGLKRARKAAKATRATKPAKKAAAKKSVLPIVKVGQKWHDDDPRIKNRTLTVLEVKGGKVTCNSHNDGSPPRRVTVSQARFKPGFYSLIEATLKGKKPLTVHTGLPHITVDLHARPTKPDYVDSVFVAAAETSVESVQGVEAVADAPLNASTQEQPDTSPDPEYTVNDALLKEAKAEVVEEQKYEPVPVLTEAESAGTLGDSAEPKPSDDAQAS